MTTYVSTQQKTAAVVDLAETCRQAQRLTYPLLADESGDLRKAFGIEPMTRVVSLQLLSIVVLKLPIQQLNCYFHPNTSLPHVKFP